jgi:molybdenum cofactor cytidylyltransferase
MGPLDGKGVIACAPGAEARSAPSASLADDSGIVLVNAVLLAAGGSRRFGSPKLLARLGHAPVLWYALDALHEAGVGETRVVFGAEADALQRCYLDWCHARGLLSNIFEVVHNEAWEEGMAGSLRAGLEGRGEAWTLVALADQPLVDAGHFNSLISAIDEGLDAVASDYDGVAGVPAIFAPSIFPLLRALQGDSGARRLLNEARNLRVRRVPFPAFERTDIDVPEDLLNAASVRDVALGATPIDGPHPLLDVRLPPCLRT